MIVSKWDQRIKRANELASTNPFASEALGFYGKLAGFQKSLYTDMGLVRPVSKRLPVDSLRQELDPVFLLPRFAAFLPLIQQNAPEPLSRSAQELRASGADSWRHVLTEFWKSRDNSAASLSPAEEFLAWIFLQPYAEYLADHTERPSGGAAQTLCPVCTARPQVGVLRQEGDGGKRSLICALCATEWEFRRIGCPACGEEDEHKLAVYTAAEFKHVRVEACDTCHYYVKTVDLTQNGHAVPAVDELATIPLNLWAAEHGYTKIQTNLLGI